MTATDSGSPPAALPRVHRAALAMLASWMGGRYYRTFRIASEPASSFDAVLTQRERRVGVTIGALWDGETTPGASALEGLVGDDLASTGDEGAYALWVPPGGDVPAQEPGLSDFRLLITRGLNGLNPGERREVRLPVTLRLAKIEAGGAYMSVSGGLAPQWTHLSEGIAGAYHLDSRDLHRLPEEQAEVEILLTRVRDRAALLETEEVTTVEVHDYWLVSRVHGSEPRGLNVIGAPATFDSAEGANVRRLLRRHITRWSEQRASGNVDLGVLLLVAPLAHIEEERVIAALRGMNPATYGAIDLIALVADGAVRQVLQPRSLPWEA